MTTRTQKIRTSFAALAMIAATLILASCQKEKENIFTATTQSYQSSKIHINSNIAYWDNGDNVIINGNIYSVSINTGDQNKAQIAASDVTPIGGFYYAAYPAEYAKINGSTATFDIPYSEIYTTNSLGDQLVNNIMVAKSDNSALAFQNVCTMLHFRIKGSSTGIGKELLAIEVSCDKPLCGTLSVDMSGSTTNSTISGSPSDTTRILTFDTPYVLSSTAKDFYLNIPAVSGATKFRVRYMFNNGGYLRIYEKTKSGTISFEKGTLYHFGEDVYNGSTVSFSGSNGASLIPGNGVNPLRITSDDIFTAASYYLGQTSKKFILDNDLSVSSTVTTLKGILDGNGHTITLTGNNALFETIEGGTVKNLTVAGNITSPTCSNYKFGAIACLAKSNAVIKNCINKANIECLQVAYTNTTYVGGICAQVSSGCCIQNCRNDGLIKSNATYTGGIVGNCNGVLDFKDFVNNGKIIFSITTNHTIYVGGIAGSASTNVSSGSNVHITNCNNYGNIEITGETDGTFYCGGLFASISSPATTTMRMEDCSNSGKISYSSTVVNSNKYFGGLIAIDGSSTSLMINCFNEGSIDAAATNNNTIAGGLLGEDRNMSIKNCYSYCNIKAQKCAGIVAYGEVLAIESTISNCYFYGTITANSGNSFGLSGNGNSSYQFSIDHCFYPNIDGIAACGSFCTTSSCSSVSSASDASMLSSLNTNKPSDGRSWVLGSNHIVFDPTTP